MRGSCRFLRNDLPSGIAAAAIINDCMEEIRRGRVAEALPRLNRLKAQGTLAKGVDYARALCFLSDGEQRNMLEARQSLLEELRLHPQQRHAQCLLHEVNERVRPLLLPPAEVQRAYPLFALLCEALLDSTMLAWPRLLHLYEATERLARGEDGDWDRGHIVECGTAGGGAAVLMAVVLAERAAASSRQPQHRVFALDTFTGMPAPSSEDALTQPAPSTKSDGRDANATAWGTGTCRSPAAHVHQLARAFSVEDRLVILPGLFDASIPAQLLARPEIQTDGIALLHIDADWYASTRTVLELLVPVMRRCDGGVGSPPRMVQVDDYYYWKGCRKAVDEYMAKWPPAATPAASAAPPAGPPCLVDVDDNAVSFTIYKDMPFSAHV